MHFHDDDRTLGGVVADYLGAALADGGAAIATPTRRAMFAIGRVAECRR